MTLLRPRMSNMFDPTMSMDSSSPEFAQYLNEFIQGCAGFTAGATVAVILRLIARWHNATKFSSDDMAITLSLLPLWGLAAEGIVLVNFGGLGKMVHDLSTQEESIYYPTVFSSYILYALAITSAKLSILLLYRRIFTTRSFRRILDIFIILCLLWCIISILITIFRCQPVYAAWSTHKTLHQLAHSCIPLTNVYYGTSISNLVLDVIIPLLPLRQIWTLQLPLRQRLLLVLCLCLGIISIAASIGRALTINSLQSEELPGAIAEPEVVAMPYLFLVIEPAFAIICACLPTYRPLAVWLGRKASSSTLGTRVKSVLGTTSTTTATTSRYEGTQRWSFLKKGTNVEVRAVPEEGIEKRTLLSVDSSPRLSDGMSDGRCNLGDLSGRVGRSEALVWSGR